MNRKNQKEKVAKGRKRISIEDTGSGGSDRREREGRCSRANWKEKSAKETRNETIAIADIAKRRSIRGACLCLSVWLARDEQVFGKTCSGCLGLDEPHEISISRLTPRDQACFFTISSFLSFSFLFLSFLFSFADSSETSSLRSSV